MSPNGPAHRDRGLTLSELLITVTILGIVMTVLASATIVFLRTQSSASARVDASRGVQQLVNYLPGDVASAQMIRSDDGANGCGSGGTSILDLRWAEEFEGAIVRQRVTYRSFFGAETRLVRFRCDDGVTTPTSTVNVARDFSELWADTARFVDGLVRLTLDYPATPNVSATSRTIVAQSRNLTGQG